MNKDLVTVIVRSFISPNEPMQGFHEGRPFEITVSRSITIGEFTEKFFSKKKNQISIVAVNKQISLPDTILSDGDEIDIYPPIEGG